MRLILHFLCSRVQLSPPRSRFLQDLRKNHGVEVASCPYANRQADAAVQLEACFPPLATGSLLAQPLLETELGSQLVATLLQGSSQQRRGPAGGWEHGTQSKHVAPAAPHPHPSPRDRAGNRKCLLPGEMLKGGAGPLPGALSACILPPPAPRGTTRCPETAGVLGILPKALRTQSLCLSSCPSEPAVSPSVSPLPSIRLTPRCQPAMTPGLAPLAWLGPCASYVTISCFFLAAESLR